MKQGLLKAPIDCVCPATRALATLSGCPVRNSTAVYMIALATIIPQFANAAAVTIDPSQTIVLVESSHNPSNESETIRSAVALPGGGIFSTGIRDKEHLWSLKVASDGSLVWKTTYSNPKEENPFVAGVLPDGSYWVAGVANTRDYVRRFDTNGVASEILPISPAGENHFFSRGIAVPEGYILTGSTKSGEQFRNQLSPWIELIDKTGKRIWERSFIDVQDRLIKSNFDRKCGGLQVTADGRITYAASVMTNHIIESVQKTNLG